MRTGERGADDTVYVAVAQFASIADTQANISSIAGLAARAAAAGARLAIFPEASSYRFASSGDELLRAAENDGEAFRTAMGEIARKNHIALVVGLYATGNDRKRSDNLLVVFGADGREQGSYHKLHLYDAFQYRESDKNTPGDLKADFAELMVFDLAPFRFGLINCYDLRFPEIARALVDLGANALVVCAGWTTGPLKEMHWETLLRARAIENTAFVLASSQPAPLSAGLSMIIDPTGVVLASVPVAEGLAFASLSYRHLEAWREIVPALKHRRYAVVQR